MSRLPTFVKLFQLYTLQDHVTSANDTISLMQELIDRGDISWRLVNTIRWKTLPVLLTHNRKTCMWTWRF